MTVIQRSALVRFSAPAMFELVDDIESYPQFLPWCQASRVLTRRGDIVEAELDISRGGFPNSFATHNTLVGREEIRMTLIEGPFSRLEGTWRFLPLREDASKISLDLEFEMLGKLANLALGTVFNQICNTMVSAFGERARVIYG